MADARLTQGPVLVPAAGDADARSTQVAVLVLSPPPAAGGRVTQAAALVLTSITIEARATQIAALVLADAVPCHTFWASLWRIERRDGTVLTYTGHDLPIPFRGEIYSPCDSLSASASDLGALIGQIGSVELAGVIADAGISEADIAGGLYDGATIEVWLVPWQQEGGEIPRRLHYGTWEKTTHGAFGYTAEVLTPGAKLQQQALLDFFGPACRWTLGDPLTCGVDIGALTVSGTVTNLAVRDAGNQARRRIFQDSSRPSPAEAAGYFDQGQLTWTSGANSGQTSEVKSFAADGTFVLWITARSEIGIGDGYDVYPGCDKTKATCTAKFANFDRFGGFHKVPGRDVLFQTPNAK